MSENVQTAMFEILKKIQGDITLVRTDIGQFKLDTETHFERIETLVRKRRRCDAGHDAFGGR
ncbi:hypothetical protein [Tardiphaga sp. 709]|uniref:hypothetical protein n=1 Tax=Tardiphaga sp. 709 TaxID=3076039 RepID=UPI0028F0A490|nr:hypothetical protein [Tardiphaga sp. 709]WNV11362.1 hypothetical protein RSO67_09400 [Tardiphaga sp. 709]